ncbi:helix-turn-helix transcriptional regulator [Chromohalobacter israelensis]|uniref:helix-turn-helix transcriptional regulator n=1 Tax=Chromohalobacter israelensis TaxID=141390 RepID=UPI0015C4D395|nr:helix-turn-helix transcriptional regulator [Chromohalobacter salexigens]
MDLGSKEWYQCLSDVVAAIDTERFTDQVIAAIHSVVSYNQIVVICYQKGKAPAFWYSQVPEARRAAVINNYLKGCYLLDPWYHAYQHELPSGLYQLGNIAPDDFFVSEFYREYYQALEIQNEAVFAIDIDGDTQIQISMGIMEKTITPQTHERLSIIAPFIIAAGQKHWKSSIDISDEASRRSAVIHEHVAHAFNNFGSSALTNRERDVAILIIRGYSLKSIATLLGVAFGTIKVHCKNLYKKLDINSQSELFALFIDEITRHNTQPIPGPDK